MRNEETLMNKFQHKKHYKSEYGWDTDACEDDWQKLVDRGAAGEGSGAAQCFWVLEATKRIRDKVKFVENELEDASKAVRDMQLQEHEELEAFVGNSDTAFNHQFLSLPSTSSADAPGSEMPKSSDLSPEHVPEISSEAPKAFERQNILMGKVIPSMQASMNNVAAAIQHATDNPDAGDRVRQYHMNTALMRQKLIRIWLAESLQDVAGPTETHSKQVEDPASADKPSHGSTTPKSPMRVKKNDSSSGDAGNGATQNEPLFLVCLSVTQ